MHTQLLTDEQLEALAQSEGLDWPSLPDPDRQFFRELKEREAKLSAERGPEEVRPFEPVPPVLRAPRLGDFDLEWFDFQTKFLLHPDLSKPERSRRERAWNRKNRYKQPPKASEILDITQEEVKDLFFYTKGELFYKNPISRKTKRGDLVSPPVEGNKRPRRVRIRYREYPLSHVVYLYHNGYLPRRIKHLDDDVQNVKIENLMEV